MSYTWPGGARLALSIVVNVEEGAEFNVIDGDRGPEPVDELGISLKKPVRNFGNESNYATASTRVHHECWLCSLDRECPRRSRRRPWRSSARLSWLPHHASGA